MVIWARAFVIIRCVLSVIDNESLLLLYQVIVSIRSPHATSISDDELGEALKSSSCMLKSCD
jgi:hypothetical protein